MQAEFSFHVLLQQAVAMAASDLHLSAGWPPVYRIQGELHPIGSPLTASFLLDTAKFLMTPHQWALFEHQGDLDFAYALPEVSRFRINTYKQRGMMSLAIRVVGNRVPSLAELSLPPVVQTFAEAPDGLVVVAGPTGHGKSTTLAAMVDHINHKQSRHILTLEDPIEYVYAKGTSMIEQRQVGEDSLSFAAGLRAALRQDPDVLLIGEMRDLETMQTALTAAETGHLVLTTLHTRDAVQTVERMVDMFPAAQQRQVRQQLASVLRGVTCQRLYPRREEPGRVAAMEVLVNTPAVANLIRTEQTHQLQTVMQTGRNQGMQTMDAHVAELVRMGIVPI
ncbi:type IV pilus twitching motility protein PilT [Alicyclobacillaceae bacterium I2511]|nr:type IV pilus twitching motility protein PilT [Alicyclobacillaceae bacterium I2511]